MAIVTRISRGWIFLLIMLGVSQSELSGQYYVPPSDYPGSATGYAPPGYTQGNGLPGGSIGTAAPTFGLEGGNAWVRYRATGNGALGFDGSYFTVGTFLPFDAPDFLGGFWFTQMQGHVSEDRGNFFGNFGIGRRVYVSDSNRTLGASIWYDYDDDRAETLGLTFHQIGATIESSGPLFDFTLNTYFPLEENSQTTQVSFLDGESLIGFRENFIVRAGFNTAFRGVDMRGMVDLPSELARRYAFRPTFSIYHYDSDVIGNFTGGAVGLQAQPNRNTLVSWEVTHDDQTGTTHYFSVALSANPLFRPGARATNYTPVNRNDHVISFNQEELILTNPDTGQPYIVRHVDNNGFEVDAGDGTVEDPYNRLAQAEGAGSDPFDIIFVRRGALSDTTGYNQGFVLQPGQRLLGDGAMHFIPTVELGLIELPGLDPGEKPELTNLNNAPVVVLADGTTVDNFQIDGGTVAVVGQDLNDIPNTTRNAFTINRVMAMDQTVLGIDIDNAQGRGILTNSMVANSPTIGARITSEGSLNLDVSNNDFNDNDDAGLQIEALGPAANITGNISNNDVDTLGGMGTNNGIVLLANAGGMMDVILSQNDSFSNVMSGMFFAVDPNSTILAELNGNTLQGNMVAGLNAEVDGTLVIQGFANDFQANVTGVQLSGSAGSTILANFTSALMSNNLSQGLEAGTSGTLTLGIDQSGINNNPLSGVNVLGFDGSDVTVSIGTSNIQMNGQSGILVDGSGDLDVSITQNLITENGLIGVNPAPGVQIIDRNNVISNTPSATITIQNNEEISDNATDGVQLVTDGNSDIFITGNPSIQNNGANGINIIADGSFGGAPDLDDRITNVVIANNRDEDDMAGISNNGVFFGGSGILVSAAGDAMGEFNMTISNNLINNNVPPQPGGITPDTLEGSVDITIAGTDNFFGGVLIEENTFDFGENDIESFSLLQLRTFGTAIAQYEVNDNEFSNKFGAPDPGLVLITAEGSRTRFIATNNDFNVDELGELFNDGAITTQSFDASELYVTLVDNSAEETDPNAYDITANDTSRVVAEVFDNMALGFGASYGFTVEDEAGLAVEFDGNVGQDGFTFDNNGTLAAPMDDDQLQINEGMNGGLVTINGPFINLDTPPPPTPVATFVTDANFRDIALPYIEIPGLP